MIFNVTKAQFFDEVEDFVKDFCSCSETRRSHNETVCQIAIGSKYDLSKLLLKFENEKIRPL